MNDTTAPGSSASGGADSAAGGGMSSDRVDQFKQEIGDLRLKGSSAADENKLAKVGTAALIGGVALAILGAVMLTTTSDSADQRAFLAQTTFLGLAFLIVGSALFIRYSLSRYLRFWMIRLIHEQRAQTDRVVEAIEKASRGE